MNMFANGSLDPENDPTTDVWPGTLEEIKARGFEVHGSLRKRNIESGATADVLKATESRSGRVVGIKVYRDPNRKVEHRNGKLIPMTNFFENERRMLAGLQSCPLVPRYYFSVARDDATVDGEIQPFHVMEFVDGRRITKYAKQLNQQKDGASRLELFRQVLMATEAIHQFGYLHRDLSDGNILVDANGNIRLIDLAEASPLGSEHTRLVSTPGDGTPGVATPEQQAIRKIQTDDVRDACTIGHAIFTGKWKEEGEGPIQWRRNLQNVGVDKAISKIIVKGMRPRDTHQKIDQTVWNTAQEVDSAIEKVLLRNKSGKQMLRSIGWTTLAASLLAAICFFAFKRIQRQEAISELNRLDSRQQVLSSKPESLRSDVRVQKRIADASAWEKQGRQHFGDDKNDQASKLFAKANSKTEEAIQIVDDLERMEPLASSFRVLLEKNDRWNHDCPAINKRLLELGKSYQKIQRLIEVQAGAADQDIPTPNVAWDLLKGIQLNLVNLIDDNQQSVEVEALLEKFKGFANDVTAELREGIEYKPIVAGYLRANSQFEKGSWHLAREELLGGLDNRETGAIPLLLKFLNKHELSRLRKQRIAELEKIESTLRAQLVENEKELAAYVDGELEHSQHKQERDSLRKELTAVKSKMQNLENSVGDVEKELETATNEKERLVKLDQKNKERIRELEEWIRESKTILVDVSGLIVNGDERYLPEGEINIVNGKVTGQISFRDPAPGGRYSVRSFDITGEFDGLNITMNGSYREYKTSWTGVYDRQTGQFTGEWKGQMPGHRMGRESGTFRISNKNKIVFQASLWEGTVDGLPMWFYWTKKNKGQLIFVQSSKRTALGCEVVVDGESISIRGEEVLRSDASGVGPAIYEGTISNGKITGSWRRTDNNSSSGKFTAKKLD